MRSKNTRFEQLYNRRLVFMLKLSGGKLIAINTISTYSRTLISIALALLSSRWVLEGLGAVDFGKTSPSDRIGIKNVISKVRMVLNDYDAIQIYVLTLGRRSILMS